MIVRRPSSHIINHYSLTYSLAHSLAQFINQPINGWVQRYVTPIEYHICDRKEIDRRICVRVIGNTMLLINIFLTAASYRHKSVLYGIFDLKKYQVYILFTKLAPISPSELRFNSKATFSFECIISFLLLFYHTLTCRCLPCPVVSTCLLLADD